MRDRHPLSNKRTAESVVKAWSLRIRQVAGALCLALGASVPALAEPRLPDSSSELLQLVARHVETLDLVDGLAFDDFGNLFAVRERAGVSGGVTFIDKVTGESVNLLSGISRADQISLSPSGELLVTSEVTPASSTDRLFMVHVSYDERQRPVSASGRSLTTSMGINKPEGLVVLPEDSEFGPRGTIYVAEDLVNGRILKVGWRTGATEVFVGEGARLDRPEGMVLGRFDGTEPLALYVAETGRNRIIRIGADQVITTVGDPETIGLTNPDNVEFGHDGFLYVSEDTSPGRVIRISVDGEHTVFASGFANPAGLGYEARARTLYIGDQADSSVWRVRPFPSALIPIILDLILE